MEDAIKSTNKYIVICLQTLGFFVFHVLLAIFYDIEITLPANFNKLKKGTLFVANHQTRLDPFIALYPLRFILFLKILPVRFPVTNEYMQKPFLSKLLKLTGCYSVGQTSRENMIALMYTAKLIKDGETVFLFPEGGVTREGDDLKKFKKGIEFFVRKSKNVVFVKMQGFNAIRLPSLRKKCSITVSPIKNLSEEELTTEDFELLLKQL